MLPLLRLVVAALLVLAALPARAFETQATAAWVYDVTTHTVLMDKNADQPVPPASMSKLMTINMLFEALRDGRVAMDTTFAVSSRAKGWAGRPCSCRKPTARRSEELIHGMIVNSGNDACVVVAEGLAGTEEAFARQMTERAKAIGMTSSTFANASGWPDPNHRMSMRDLGILALRLIEEFPEYYPVFAETEFNYKDRAPDNRFNRNPLLKLGIGADGLKTGHTSEAGYGLVGSAVQGDRRIIFAITGLASDEARAEEAERIVGWAFRQFAEKTVAKAGVRVAEAEVFLGDSATVGLVPAEDLRLLVPAIVQDGVQAEVVYKGPLIAPVEAREPRWPNWWCMCPTCPTTASSWWPKPVGKAGFVGRLKAAAGSLYDRYLGAAAPAS
jgi:D-alanyl-D-alanine carboxypeptidase (penicillin-binding protein 5/6)